MCYINNFMRKNKFNSVYMPIVILIIFMFVASCFFYNFMYYGDYKKPYKNVYTCHDYFTNLCNEEKIASANYTMYMYSAFVNMLEDKELVIDNRISEDILLHYGIEPIEYISSNIGVLQEKVFSAPQEYGLVDEHEKEHKVFLFTGFEWELADTIEMFYDVDKNLIVAPKDTFLQKDFHDMSIAKEEFSYANVNMQIKNDETIQRIAGVGKESDIILRNIEFTFFIILVGFLVLRGFYSRLKSIYIWILFPMGGANQVISTILMTIFHIRFKLVWYIIISCFVAIITNIILKRLVGIQKRKVPINRGSCINMIVYVIMILLFCCIPYVLLSYDSVLNIYIGKYAVQKGELNSYLGRTSSYSLLTPLLEVGSALFGIDLNYSLQPIITVASIMIIGWLCYKMMGHNASKKRKVGIIALVAFAVMFNPMFYIQSFWKLNNLIMGLMIGFVVGFHVLYYRTNVKYYFYIGNIFLAIVSIARIESGLFTATYMIALYVLYEDVKKEKEVTRLSLVLTMILSGIYIYYLIVIGNVDSAFWTPGKGGAMVLLCWVTSICLIVLDCMQKKIMYIYKNIDIVMLTSIMIVIPLLALYDGARFLNNIFCYMCNSGNYGGFWVVMAVVSLYSLQYWRKSPVIRFLAIYLVSYVVLIFELMIFREVPLRVGFGDSACRMLSHVLIVAGMLGVCVADAWIRKKVSMETGKNG